MFKEGGRLLEDLPYYQIDFWILYIYIDPKIENKTLDTILLHDILGAYKWLSAHYQCRFMN